MTPLALAMRARNWSNRSRGEAVAKQRAGALEHRRLPRYPISPRCLRRMNGKLWLPPTIWQSVTMAAAVSARCRVPSPRLSRVCAPSRFSTNPVVATTAAASLCGSNPWKHSPRPSISPVARLATCDARTNISRPGSTVSQQARQHELQHIRLGLAFANPRARRPDADPHYTSPYQPDPVHSSADSRPWRDRYNARLRPF